MSASAQVFEMRSDVLLIHLPWQRKAASKMPDRKFGVEGFESVVICGLDLTAGVAQAGPFGA